MAIILTNVSGRRNPMNLTNEKATALITLFARAHQSRSGAGILDDRWAEEAAARIDYDFGQLKADRWRSLLISARAKQLDQWTRAFLDNHPRATVLHLGCGLDSRVHRIDPPASVRWFDIDFPETIELRGGLFPEREGYTMIGASLADPLWLDRLMPDGPALIVAEGVTQYLTEDVIRSVLNRVTDRFPFGAFAFDVHSMRLVRWADRKRFGVRGTGARFRWGLDDPGDIRRLEPRLELVSRVTAARLARENGLPWRMRAALASMNLVPALRAMTCLLYRFPPGSSQE